MAQILRICKPDICFIVRNYGTQRYQQNHYETLNVSSDASQKEIRRAFIRLSKQLHPDTSRKCTHDDFVRLNEAYSILGKENTRRQYDIDLKYRCNPYNIYGNPQNMQYGSRWEYEVHTAGGPWPPPPQKPNTNFGLLVALLFFGLGILQAISVFHSIRMRKHMLSQSARLEYEYRKVRDIARTKSRREMASIMNLDEYLDKNNNHRKYYLTFQRNEAAFFSRTYFKHVFLRYTNDVKGKYHCESCVQTDTR